MFRYLAGFLGVKRVMYSSWRPGLIAGALALSLTASAFQSTKSKVVSPKITQIASPKWSVMQGLVTWVSKGLISVAFLGSASHQGRQVNIANAIYENESGKVVPSFPIRVGDSLILIVDPNAPIYSRPKTNGRMMPMHIMLLPLKALVVEAMSPELHGSPPGANKG